MKKPVVIGLAVAGVLVLGAGVFAYIKIHGLPGKTPAAETVGPEKAASGKTDEKPAPSPSETLSDGGLKKYEAGDLDGAMADYTQAITLDSLNWLAYFRRARVYEDQKKYTEALADYSYAISHNTADIAWVSGALYLRGLVNGNLSNTDAALVDFNKSIELNPKQVAPRMARARLTTVITTPDSALDDYNAVLEMQPAHAEALFHRGLIHYWQRDWKGARADLDSAVAASPKDQEYILWAALVRRRAHETVAAADFPNIDGQTWPGPISAYLAGDNGALKSTMEKLGTMPEAQRADTLCQIALASVAITQAEVAQKDLAQHQGAAEKGLSFCSVARPFEAKIMQQELTLMKAK